MTQLLRLTLSSTVLGLVFAVCQPGLAQTRSWSPIGPDGGDARRLASDPSNANHVYLGTTNSWIYETEDGGATWRRLAKLSKSDDLVLDDIVVDQADPKRLLAGAHVVERADGGLFISHDAGKTWAPVDAMKLQSIRALAQAPSNPKIVVAGTLRGVFRSTDGGVTWSQISPLGSMELHEVESVAIDPIDPSIIYAGTWHLPWKTSDGGATWHTIKQGLIVDSDVFSIIIDPTRRNVVYTSACSGIYRSNDGGEFYRKVQGIPAAARRTRVLTQDPVNRNIVYAGTTEGLYKTKDGGVNWRRMTGPDVIINDVYVDPQNTQHVLLATDRSGILESDDAAESFKESNDGFSQRQVASLLVDQKNPQTVYAGVVNDKQYGGVFVSSDNGESWSQQSKGLEGRDVFTLAQAADGTLLAGTNAGIFEWSGSDWQPDGHVMKVVPKTIDFVHRGKRSKVTISQTAPGGQIDGRIGALVVTGDRWYAATSSGVFTSANQGASWEGGPVLGRTDFLTVAAHGPLALAAQRSMLALSSDSGRTWQALAMPEKLSWVNSVCISPDGSLWLGGREGVFSSRDQGQSWQKMATLPVADISELSYDPDLKRIIVTSSSSTLLLAIDPGNKTWKWWDPGWMVRSVRSSGGRLLAATRYNGVVIQPKDLTTTAAIGTQ